MLRELKSVIAIRATEREERERQAFQRQYPDAKFYDPMPVLRNQNESQHDDSSGSSSPTSKPVNIDHGDDYKCDEPIEDTNRPKDDDLGTAASDHPMPLEDGARDELKEKLANLGGANFAFSSTVAAMAAARSHQMAAMSEETFGDEDVSDGSNLDGEEFIELSAGEATSQTLVEQDLGNDTNSDAR